jgi:hypothetical protein
MQIRDAVESDAEALAAATDRPREVVTNMVHARSVRVAVGDDGEGVVGFVAFDVRDDTVHVTDFDGEGSTIERLFEEPRRFARREGMGVEVVVPTDDRVSGVIEELGFAAAGRGPRFEGRPTTRYRIEFEALDGEKRG